MTKFRFRTGIGYVGCEEEEIIEIPDEYLDECETKEEEKLIDNWFDEWVWQQIEPKTGWQKLEE
jgi:hypothetical protein